MATPIKAYAESLKTNSHLRFVVQNDDVQTKEKQAISCWDGLLGRLGLGTVSFKNVCTCIRKHFDTFLTDYKDWALIGNMIKNYNASHVAWKRVHELPRSPLIHFDSLSPDEQKRIDKLELFPSLNMVQDSDALASFCRDLRYKWREHFWRASEVGVLIMYVDDLSNAVLKIRERCGKDATFVNAFLQLRAAVKACLVDGKAAPQFHDAHLRNLLKEKLQKMQKIVLEAFFEQELKHQGKIFNTLRKTFKDNFKIPSPFLEGELKRWEQRHARGKLISLPKWYHCTRAAASAVAIFHDEIKYMYEGAFPGAFVSNKPEMDRYGRLCFALSDYIQKTGTTLEDGTTKLPSYSFFEGNVTYSDKPKVTPLISFKKFLSAFHIKESDSTIWFGFKRGIPIATVSKHESPLEYYRDTTLSYLVYDETCHAREPLLKEFRRTQYASLPEKHKVLTAVKQSPGREVFQKDESLQPNGQSLKDAQKGFIARTVRVITRSQIDELRKLIKKADLEFTLPEEWDGQLESF